MGREPHTASVRAPRACAPTKLHFEAVAMEELGNRMADAWEELWQNTIRTERRWGSDGKPHTRESWIKTFKCLITGRNTPCWAGAPVWRDGEPAVLPWVDEPELYLSKPPPRVSEKVVPVPRAPGELRVGDKASPFGLQDAGAVALNGLIGTIKEVRANGRAVIILPAPHGEKALKCTSLKLHEGDDKEDRDRRRRRRRDEDGDGDRRRRRRDGDDDGGDRRRRRADGGDAATPEAASPAAPDLPSIDDILSCADVDDATSKFPDVMFIALREGPSEEIFHKHWAPTAKHYQGLRKLFARIGLQPSIDEIIGMADFSAAQEKFPAIIERALKEGPPAAFFEKHWAPDSQHHVGLRNLFERIGLRAAAAAAPAAAAATPVAAAASPAQPANGGSAVTNPTGTCAVSVIGRGVSLAELGSVRAFGHVLRGLLKSKGMEPKDVETTDNSVLLRFAEPQAAAQVVQTFEVNKHLIGDDWRLRNVGAHIDALTFAFA